MKFSSGEVCYIVENNVRVSPARVLKQQGRFYIIQISGSKGGIRLPESRLYKTEEEALAAIKRPIPAQHDTYQDNNDYVDVFKGHRNNRSPHL